ncbi:uncharacterized protein LOC131006454 [Salvia miltiorrhiza]|uniref:uncharacterized protein LOC131006454 n=1 Tax=Salvia miltiorrhiza TaxID=226208 RepID=UPI0025ACCE40|nr:uncharacterized protein LOC131006454 [Salvia miltiorrhiza]
MPISYAACIILRIVNAVQSDPYFQQRANALGRSGFTPLHKCTVAIRMLANGGAADQYDEYLRVAKSTLLECMCRFCRVINQLFGVEYLRRPTPADCQRLVAMHEEKHGFPGMLEKSYTSNAKSKRLKVIQEPARKDIERAVGVLQARWAIIKGPPRLWSKEELSDIMFTCIHLHNMIIQDEGEHATEWEEEGNDEASSSSAAARPCTGAPPEFRAYVARQASMRDAEVHARLTWDLKEHIWSRFGPIKP